MQDLQHADCTVTPQPQPTPHGGQDQLNKHHYDLPEYDEKPSLTELIEDSTPPPYIPLTGSPPTVLTTLEYCSLPPLSLSCKLQGYLESTNILLVASSMSPAPQGEQRAALPGSASGGVQRAALPGPVPGGIQRAVLPGPGGGQQAALPGLGGKVETPGPERAAALQQGEQHHASPTSPALKQTSIKSWTNKRCTSLPALKARARSTPCPARPPYCPTSSPA